MTEGRSDCAECGQSFTRLCACGATYTLFQATCPECGRAHRRKFKRDSRKRKRKRRVLRAVGDALTAPLRVPAERLRRMRRRRAAVRRARAPRPLCPECRKPLEERAPGCPHCGANLASTCGCGGTIIRVFDSRCRTCGRSTHKKKKRARAKLPWLIAGVSALVLLGAGLLVLQARGSRGTQLVHYFQEGVAALTAGQHEDAIGWFEKFLSEVPDDAPARFMLGQALYRAGERERGLEEVRRALAIEPGMDEANLFLGRLAAREGRDEEALAFLRSTIRKDPKPAEAYLLLGMLDLRAERVQQGIENLTKGVLGGLEPPPVDAALLLGDLYAERFRYLGRTDDQAKSRQFYGLAARWSTPEEGDPLDPERDAALARAYLGLGPGSQSMYRQAQYRAQRAAGVATGSRKGTLLLLQARALYAQGAVENASRAADEALEADPSATGHLSVADFWGEVGEAEKRVEVLDAARTVYPKDLEVLLAWADGLCAVGRAREASETLRAASDFGAEPRYHLALADSLWRAGREEEALEVLAAARKRFPDDEKIRLAHLSARIDDLGRRGEEVSDEVWAGVRDEIDEVSRELPRNPFVMLLRGKSLLYRGDAVRAVDAFEAAVDADPTSLKAAIYLGLANHRAGDYEEASIRLARALARTGAELPAPRLALADCYYRLKLYQRASTTIDELVAMVPDDTRVRNLRGRILLAESRYEDAAREFEAIERLEPGRIDTALYLGYLGLLSGRTTEAEEAFARARGLAKTPEEAFQVARVEAEYYRQVKLGDRAQSVYEAFVRDHPDHMQARLGLSDFLLSMGRKEEALAAYQRCLALDPENLSVRRRICEFYFEEGERLESVDRQIAEIERRSADDPVLHYLRGKLATARGDPAKGAVELGKYVEQVPDDADGQYALGIALFRSGDNAAAVKRLEAASALMPHSLAIRHALGQVLQALAAELHGSGAWERARDVVKKALGYDPDLDGAQLLLASSVAQLGEVALSEDYCLAAVRKDPENVDAIRLLGAIRARRGDLSGAADAYQRAADLAKDPSHDLYMLASTYLSLENYPAALEEARKAKEGVEDPMYAADVIVAALLGSGESKEAESYLKDILKVVPESAQGHALLGQVRRARGDLDGAIQSFGTALDFDPKLIWALWQLADVQLVDRGQRDAALEEVSLRYERSPDDPEMNYLMAWLHTSSLDREGALPYLAKALEVNPGNRHAAILQAQVCAELGKREEGRAALQAVLKEHPRDAEVLFNLAASYDRAGETELAVRRYREAVDADARYAPALNNLAMHVLDVPGGEKEARILIERALTVSPGNPAYLDTLGRVQIAMRNFGEAKRTLMEAVKILQSRRNEMELELIDPDQRAFRERNRAQMENVDRRMQRTKAALNRVREAQEGE